MARNISGGEAAARSLAEMQKRIDLLVHIIPNGYDFSDESHDPDELKNLEAAVHAVMAIEEEWIIDPDIRAELSAISFVEDDDDEDDEDD